MPITLSDLEDAYEYANVSPYGEVEVWVDRLTGRVYSRSDYEEEELPDDIDTNARYVMLPDKLELDLGKPLALAFARRFLEADFQTVREIFSRRGAYGRFKDLLARRNALEKWYDFEAEATREALAAWAEDNEIVIVEAVAPSSG